MTDGRKLADGFFDFDAVQIGDWYRTSSLTVTADHIDRFANLTGDRFEIHMSDERARAHGFRGRVAHGLLVLSLVDGLKNQAETRLDAVASLGWDWSFQNPVLIGDNHHRNVDRRRQTPNPARRQKASFASPAMSSIRLARRCRRAAIN